MAPLRDHPASSRRALRVRTALWALLGPAAALLLIFGSLAALDREVLGQSEWQRFDGGPNDGSVVLASDPPPAPVATSAPSARPEPRRVRVTSGGRAGTGPVPRVTGGEQAPADPAQELRVEVEAPRATPPAAEPAVERFVAVGDTDGDGLTDRAEMRMGTDLRDSDSDSDELPDGWEARHGLDPRSEADAGSDADGDGLWARTEYRVRSNPTVADTDANGVADGEDDSDGDRVPNGAEQGIPGLDPTEADSDDDGVDDGAADADGDGLANADEVAGGTDPTAPTPPAEAPAEAAPAPEPTPAPADDDDDRDDDAEAPEAEHEGD